MRLTLTIEKAHVELMYVMYILLAIIRLIEQITQFQNEVPNDWGKRYQILMCKLKLKKVFVSDIFLVVKYLVILHLKEHDRQCLNRRFVAAT